VRDAAGNSIHEGGIAFEMRYYCGNFGRGMEPSACAGLCMPLLRSVEGHPEGSLCHAADPAAGDVAGTLY
jgi:hypothetical protein